MNGGFLNLGIRQRDGFGLHAVDAGKLLVQLVALRDHSGERSSSFGERAHAVLAADSQRVEPLLLIEQLHLGFFVARCGFAQALLEVHFEAGDFVLQRLEAVAQQRRRARLLSEGSLEAFDALRLWGGRCCLRSSINARSCGGGLT